MRDELAHGGSATDRFSHALRSRYQCSGKTLRSLEKEACVSDSSLSRYFRGRAMPAWSTVESICRALDVRAEGLRPLWDAAMIEKSRADTAPSAAPPAPATPNLVRPAAATVVPPPTRPELAASSAPPRPRPGRPRLVGPLTGSRRWWDGPRPRLLWLVAGVAAGFVLGAAVTSSNDSRAGAAPAPAASLVPHPGPVAGPTVAATMCPWKYVVSDGVPNDLRVFDDPQRDSIIARYVPTEVFYAPEPPQIVNQMLHTANGWVLIGKWVRRYPGPCHRGVA